MRLERPCQDSEPEGMGSWRRMVGETLGPGEAGTLASGEDGCYSVETVEGDTPGMDVGSC